MNEPNMNTASLSGVTCGAIPTGTVIHNLPADIISLGRGHVDLLYTKVQFLHDAELINGATYESLCAQINGINRSFALMEGELDG